MHFIGCKLQQLEFRLKKTNRCPRTVVSQEGASFEVLKESYLRQASRQLKESLTRTIHKEGPVGLFPALLGADASQTRWGGLFAGVFDNPLQVWTDLR